MKGKPVPPERWKPYREQYEHGDYYCGSTSTITSIVETDKAVVVNRRIVYESNELAPKQSKSTCAKYLCIGGPTAGDWLTTLEVDDSYYQFNASRGAYRGRKARPAEYHTMVFIHEHVLG